MSAETTTTPTAPNVTKALNDIPAFIVETILRFLSRSPKYFQVISWITGLLSFIMGIPALIVQLNSFLHVNIALPEWWTFVNNGSAALFTLGMWLTARLTANKTVGDSGAIAINKNNVKPLPFTSKKEAPVK